MAMAVVKGQPRTSLRRHRYSNGDLAADVADEAAERAAGAADGDT